MRVALAQYHPAASTGANLDLIGQIMERAGQENADLICFSSDFLGYEKKEDDSVIAKVQELAETNQLEMLCGRIKLDDGLWAQSVLIGSDGLLVDWAPIGEIKLMRSCIGTTVALSEEQAYSGVTDTIIAQLKPKVMVMQASAISLLELEAIKELAIDRSFNQAHLVICISVVGRCRDEQCLGTSLAVLQGKTLVEADTVSSELIMFSINPAEFIDYDELRDPVVIPELLKQKYTPHPER